MTWKRFEQASRASFVGRSSLAWQRRGEPARPCHEAGTESENAVRTGKGPTKGEEHFGGTVAGRGEDGTNKFVP